MPSARIAVSEIQTWTPAIDPRAAESGAIFVLDGSKNYTWDAKGPKSGFGCVALEGGSIESGLHNVQSVELGEHVVMMTGSQALDRRSTLITPESLEPSKDYWFTLANFNSEPESDIGRFYWTGAYVGQASILAHPSYGLYELNGDALNAYVGSADVDDPIAVVESNGRLIILTNSLVIWSNAFDPKDLTPALGGAGFQLIAEHVPGNPIMITTFQGGFLVWTDAGCMLAEYRGGDSVYRFDRVITDQLLLNAASWTQYSGGNTLVCTEQGIFNSNPSNGMTPLSPEFNEFLREELKNAQNPTVRLNYIRETDELYVQLMDGTTNYVRTHVYKMGVNKWGSFDPYPNHKGICRFTGTPGDFGYVNHEGYAHRFADVPWCEHSDGSFDGLDSKIILGYFRPLDGSQTTDVEFEMQEIITSAVNKETELYPVTIEDWMGPDSFVSFDIGFYSQDEDWNQFSPSDYDEDWNALTGSEDYNLLPSSESFDYNDDIVGPHQFDWNDPGAWEDWGATPEGGVDTDYIIDWMDGVKNAPDEDWGGWSALYNRLSYDLKVYSNLDGYEPILEVIPTLARKSTSSDFYTLLSSGHNHRIVFEANQVWQKFHVKTLETTINYQGQIS